MKKLMFLLFAMIFVIASCRKETSGDDNGGNLNGDEAVVEMTFISPSASSVRSVRDFTPGEMRQPEKGTADENKINTLDLLIFKGNKFQYHRRAVPFGPTGLTFKATMKVDTGLLTAHFIANGSTLIEKLLSEGKIVVGASWETIRSLFADSPARSFDTPSERADLPMWGTKGGLSVSDKVITHWQGVKLLRAVASVDVSVAAAVTNFELVDGRLYFVPNKGCWAPSPENFGSDYDWETLYSESPEGMTTGTGTTPNVVGPFNVEVGEKSIANKFYLYDNDTKEDTYAKITRQYTRLIVGGKYEGELYYYPIDFIKAVAATTTYNQITRNWKYLFVITSVRGPGYPNPETAAEMPPVHMTTNIFNWNLTDPNEHLGYDGQYYVSLAEKSIYLSRFSGATRHVKFSSNAKPSIILMDFTKVVNNGKQEPITNGIKNDRFKVEKVITDIAGVSSVTELLFTAIGPYQTDPSLADQNRDQIEIKVGNIVITIDITQLNRDPGDWENGGNEGIELIGN